MASPFATFRDASTSDGRKLWEMATKPLKSEYDGGKSGYTIFKSQARNKIRTCHWTDINSFVVNGQVFTLVDNADLIPINDVHAAKEERERIILTGARDMEQDEGPNNQGFTPQQVADAELQQFQAQMQHDCLVASITGDLELHVAELQNQDKTYNDGPTLLKLIQDKARGKAVRQQMKNVRESIKNLSLKEHKWNITVFNDRLKSLIATLKKNEEQFLDKDIADVVVNNYKLVKHQDFASMITLELNTAEKADKDVDYEELMEIGNAKFESLVTQGVWGKRTPQEEQILALQAQVRDLQSQHQKQGSKKGQNAPDSSSSNNKKKKNKRQPNQYEEWHFENPDNKSTMKKTVKIKGAEQEVIYHWCKNHNENKGMWVRHKPSECNRKDKGNNKSKDNAKKDKPKLVASQTILDEGSDGEQK